MILADQIISLRKRAGWSQEELAQQLNVTRQSVSKWEGAQSVPDMDKILQMSRIFGVTTDFLLKDELEEEQSVPAEESAPALRRVTMGEASQYLAIRREAAPKMALATLLCVLSPVTLMFLAALSEIQRFGISANAAAGVGLCVLLTLVAIAVVMFLGCGAKAKEFSFLEQTEFETEYGVSGMVKERRKEFQPVYNRLNAVAAVLCILSVMPLFASSCFEAPDAVYVMAVCVLLVIAGIGAALFVYGGTVNAAMEKLLEEGDYTRERKARSRVTGAVSVCYWPVVTAIFLFYTFGPMGNGQPRYSWFIWAIAGVLYAALMAVLRIVGRRK